MENKYTVIIKDSMDNAVGVGLFAAWSEACEFAGTLLDDRILLETYADRVDHLDKDLEVIPIGILERK